MLNYLILFYSSGACHHKEWFENFIGVRPHDMLEGFPPYQFKAMRSRKTSFLSGTKKGMLTTNVLLERITFFSMESKFSI
jgi:hypothetical protein